MNIKQEILKVIEIMIDEKIGAYKADITYKSVIKNVNKKGYVILDRSGGERTVKCCIPGVELKIGQSVWVKEPGGRLSDLHVVGVVY